MNKLLLTLGAMLLCSCSIAEPAWEGTKQGTNAVIGTGEDVVSWVWQEGVYGLVTGTEGVATSEWGGAKDLTNIGVVTAEDTVYAAYDFVTGPFTSDEGEE